MICPECQTQYRLDPDKLGAGGRTVRCTDCRHTWFYALKEKLTVSVPSVDKKVEKVLKDDDAAFEAILSGNSSAALSSSASVDAVSEEKGEEIRQLSTLPVVTHNPFGVDASAFGMLTFFLCVFLTMTIIFLAQRPILRHWPQMSLLYETIGFDLKAPGEGLRISELFTGIGVDGSFMVGWKITNMAEHMVDAPPLRVILKNAQDEMIKEWDIKSSGVKFAAGEVVPVTLQLTDAPEEGVFIEVCVKGE